MSEAVVERIDPGQVPDLPGERVTRSLLRQVTHPSGLRFALITLDNGEDHTKPTTLGPGGLKSLATALDEAEASDADAIALTGKPFFFLVGFDLTAAKQRGGREAALTLSRYAHQVFGRLGTGKPSFAFVNGAAMGGGVELALHCQYRTISSGVPAIALPECFLGLVPAWGGTYLLPNLVGADAAVRLIVENPLNQNRTIKGPEAHRIGLADAMFEPADFLERSLDWAAGVLDGSIAVSRPEVDRGDAWTAAVARGKAVVDQRVHGKAPAPYRALELIELARTATREEAFEAESQVGADLGTSEEFHAGLYAFDLVQKRAKRPAGAPDRSLARPVTSVGIVGAGLMASQLALLFVRRLKVPIVMTDLDQERVDRGVGYVHAELDTLLGKGRLTPDETNRLKALVTGSTSKEPFAEADFVIEAVFEDIAVKQKVFAELEGLVKPDCVLATNTSSLSVTEMAAGLDHPERVVGFHFFNPVAVMPFLEVVRGEQTDDPTLATAFAVAKELKKTAVLVKDSPAFIVNRLLGRWLGEVARVVDEGTPIAVADSAFAGLAPMPPFVLLGLVGPAVALHTSETLHAAFPERFHVSANLRRVVQAGKNAIYTWVDGRPVLDPEVAALFEQPAHPVVLDAEAVRERVLAALAEEVRLMLDEGVVAEPHDIDLGLITGAGFSFWNGGLTPLLDRMGISERVTGRRFLPLGVASPVPA